jgi:hypothetical protein
MAVQAVTGPLRAVVGVDDEVWPSLDVKRKGISAGLVAPVYPYLSKTVACLAFETEPRVAGA